MRLGIKLVFAASVAFVLLAASGAYAAPQDDLKSVLLRLDAAAAGFRSTSADFEFVTVQSDPVYDKDTQKGTVYYKRSGKSFQMAAHIRTEANGEGQDKPIPKDVLYSGGKVTLYEKLTDEVHVRDAAKYESYLLLGFGASGKELADKWEIKYLGSETLNDGKTAIATEKLELLAKDPDVRKLFPKVTIWVDPARAVSLKQVFDEGQGQSRTCRYFNIKTNLPLPDSDFTIKTDSKTKTVK
jgi:outer membrane lipoprotein-sorting protein